MAYNANSYKGTQIALAEREIMQAKGALQTADYNVKQEERKLQPSDRQIRAQKGIISELKRQLTVKENIQRGTRDFQAVQVAARAIDEVSKRK